MGVSLLCTFAVAMNWNLLDYMPDGRSCSASAARPSKDPSRQHKRAIELSQTQTNADAACLVCIGAIRILIWNG
jgi:hypothetical protein